MLIHLTLSFLINLILMNINLKGILVYLIVVLLFRIKYELNYGFQRSINEIHLFYDKLFKKLKFRNCYQKCYKFLVKVFLVNDYNSGKRVLRYWDKISYKMLFLICKLINKPFNQSSIILCVNLYFLFLFFFKLNKI